MSNLSYKAKIQLLRQLVEALMWEMDAIRSGQWDQIPKHTQNKQTLTEKMAEFDWTPSPMDRDELEYLSLKSQIIDLEYQVRKSLEVNLETVKLQMTDLRQRHNRWKAAIAPYLQK
ncbi:MAG: hypothetical protein V4507_11010 [Verrucomicrobiota bacterium]